MYTQEIAIAFDHSRLGLGNKFFSKRNNPIAHLHELYDIFKVNLANVKYNFMNKQGRYM